MFPKKGKYRTSYVSEKMHSWLSGHTWYSILILLILHTLFSIFSLIRFQDFFSYDFWTDFVLNLVFQSLKPGLSGHHSVTQGLLL